jgi:polyketide cyclase/dehydrase/lipid transport protein
MSLRKTFLLVAIGACYVTASMPATLKKVDVSRREDRYRVVADTHLEASPEAIYKVLMDFDADHYQRISEIYKESSYLPPDRDGTPLVYTRVEGCLLRYCRSMSRVERLEVVTPQFIRSRTVPERSDFKYSLSEWTFEPEGAGTRVTYLMEMEPDFWLPPFVGPWFLKRTLVKGAPAAIDRIEQLAQQEDRAATSAAAR